ncbi:hypothetical protein QUA52_30440, partial [Microcoleus sp. N9_A3]|uniref:hypothetical protein n=1 Tax=Microcoleus sp. N9_A3 TaxID=3055382 RepID=UPI002FD06E3E
MKNCQTFENFFVFITFQTQHLATPRSTQRSLELYTGFYTTYNPKPNFLLLPSRYQQQQDLDPITTHIFSVTTFLQNRLSSEALDYSTN